MQGPSGSFYPGPRPPATNGAPSTSGNSMNGAPPPYTYGGPPAHPATNGPASAPQQQNWSQPQPPVAQMQQIKLGGGIPGPGSVPIGGAPPQQQPTSSWGTGSMPGPPPPGAPRPMHPGMYPNSAAPLAPRPQQPQQQPQQQQQYTLPAAPRLPAGPGQFPPPQAPGGQPRPSLVSSAPSAPMQGGVRPLQGSLAPGIIQQQQNAQPFPYPAAKNQIAAVRPPAPSYMSNAPLPQPPVPGSSGIPGSAPQSPQSGIALQMASPSPVKHSHMGGPAVPGGVGGGPGRPMFQPQHPIGGLARPPLPGGMPMVPPGPGFAAPGLPPPPGSLHQQPQGPPVPYGAPMPPPPTHFGAQPGMQVPGIGVSGGPLPPPSPTMQAMAPPSFGGDSSRLPPIPGPNAPPATQAMGSGSRTIDPGQMPRPSGASLPTQVFETRRGNAHSVPPPSDVPIVVRDTGNASPRLIRSSLNSVPQGSDILKSSSLPFVVIINPLAVLDPGDSPIPIVSPGPSGPLRCAQCKAYVCPYMKWRSGGRQMECCFCGGTTDVPQDHYGYAEADGSRRDKAERPELAFGSVEFDVAGEYQVRPPAPPTFLFLIDATAAAVASGATATVCASLAQLLPDLPGGDATRVGIATFDSSLHFYAVKPGGGAPQMQIVSDVAEPFCPLGSSSVVNARQYHDSLVALLQSIPKMFAGSQAGESAAGAALAAGVAALQAGVGGRLIAFISSLPHRGALALRPREAGRPPSERDTLEVMSPEGKHYTELANTAAEHQVSVDIFALTQGYADLATLCTLCTTTSGSLNRYNPFVPAADSARFHNDLRWALVRPQGLEAVARLRVSRGLAVDNYVGAFHRRNATDLHFPALSCDHAVAARIIHEERLQEGTEAYLQYALLYSTTDGARRVRVLTVALPVTRSLGSVFRGADLEAYLAYVARKVSQQLPGRTLVACKGVVSTAAVDTLVAYRKHCASASSSGQLILPESLKLLPLYALGLQKLPCFRTDSRADSRAVWMARLLSLPADRIIPSLHPRLVALHTLPGRPANAPIVPDRLPLTAEKLDPEGIFLLENGFDAYLFVGSGVSPETCTQLLGVPTPDSVNAAEFSAPPVLDNPLSRAVAAVLDEVRRQRRSYMHLRLVWRGHPQEAGCVASLVEDRSPSAGMSYVEYLCFLHRQIQNRLT